MEVKHPGMAWVGKVEEVLPIEGADRIQRANVDCKNGGKWAGVTSKDIVAGKTVIVFMPDAILPHLEPLSFMEKRGWRVKPAKFLKCPSEVVIVNACDLIGNDDYQLGDDVTESLGVFKYEKDLPAELNGLVEGNFPSFIPKTDEPNFQAVPEMIELLKGKECYISSKADGSSLSAFKYNDHFGVCSRNWELKDGTNAYWQVAKKYNLPENLPEGLAIQAELVGPSVQGNPLGLKELEARLFNVFDITKGCYLGYSDVSYWSWILGIPMVDVERVGVIDFGTPDDMRHMAEGTYPNGKQREGIVVRPTKEMQTDDGKMVSFKVLNLTYKEGR